MPVGNETEVSLIKWLQGAQINVHKLMHERVESEAARIPFNSEAKRSIVASRPKDMADTVRVYVKGAPEYVLPNCDSHFNASAQKVPLGSDTKDYIVNRVIKEQMTTQGLRTLAFSYREFTEEQFADFQQLTNNFSSDDAAKYLEEGNTLLAIVAMKDPLRPRVNQLIKYAEKGGVNVRMVTNNSLETAIAVAIEAGVLRADYLEMGPADQKARAMHAADFRHEVGGVKTE